MTTGWHERWAPQGTLREIVQQATAALICMDSKRLEELARCCADLNREIQPAGPPIAVQQNASQDVEKDTAYDMELFERILRETRANLTVFSRLHVMRLREVGMFAEGSSLYGADAIRNLGTQERKAVYGDN